MSVLGVCRECRECVRYAGVVRACVGVEGCMVFRNLPR